MHDDNVRVPAIDGQHVKFVPEVLGEKHSEFVVSVALVDLPDDAHKRTIVYEGSVVNRNGRDRCDPIHFVKPAQQAPVRILPCALRGAFSPR